MYPSRHVLHHHGACAAATMVAALAILPWMMEFKDTDDEKPAGLWTFTSTTRQKSSSSSLSSWSSSSLSSWSSSSSSSAQNRPIPLMMMNPTTRYRFHYVSSACCENPKNHNGLDEHRSARPESSDSRQGWNRSSSSDDSPNGSDPTNENRQQRKRKKRQQQQQHQQEQSIRIPSRFQRLLHALHLRKLPIPRVLTPSDPVFTCGELKRGLKQRARDEELLRNIQREVRMEIQKQRLRQQRRQQQQLNDGDENDEKHRQIMNQLFFRMSRVAYGKGVTPQMREDFMVRYGCTAWTDEILSYLVQLASERGIVEVGAGHGQWARAITDYYTQHHGDSSTTTTGDKQDGMRGMIRPQTQRTPNRGFEFVLPFDDMTNLPLSPKIYHRHTKPAHEYFHPHVRTCQNHIDAMRRYESHGRVLLLVYPPPGPMALETVKAYVDAYPEGNDTVVYVGEGRGGANGNNELFDYWLNGGEWVLIEVMSVKPPLGGKGFEKMFVLKKRQKRIMSNE